MTTKQKTKEFSFSTQKPLVEAQTPELISSHRKEAWEVYRELPFPTLKDEAWRRTSLRSLDAGALKLADGRQAAAAADDIPDDLRYPLPDDLAGGEALIGPGGISVELDPELKEEGVIFTDLLTAAREYPRLVEKVLGQAVPAREGKFAALTAAYAPNGLFVYVPRGLQVDKVLHSLTWAGAAGQAQLTQLLIYLDQGSSLTFIQESSSPAAADGQSLLGENVEIVVGQNAHLRMVELQTLGDSIWSFAHKRALLGQDGSLDWVIGALGSYLSKHFLSLDLTEKGAEGRVSGLFFADRNQHLSYNTQQNHLAPRTNSDLLFKGGLTGDSRSVWRGMIYVSPDAQYIDGYQANRNLILSDQARSDSIPGLEIMNNDVRCTHGSTMGKIDPEQLFYLQTRGIPRSEAERLIVQGFFDEVLNQIPVQGLQDRLWSAIETSLY